MHSISPSTSIQRGHMAAFSYQASITVSTLNGLRVKSESKRPPRPQDEVRSMHPGGTAIPNSITGLSGIRSKDVSDSNINPNRLS